ncbi:GroES-like protein [Rhizopogon vinicolor AM-OR11-026]|uniref:GroES-like protein n=1 Tax=Rhizopogon vinicolor AM-OR11-026 TaxID=1314800 RepID=A0A1B7MNF1_9AGAM|nr:GroES-like protein [Rhizopogon vinicolor AM-OR11-026]
MQALKFEKTGSLDNLSLVNIDKPTLRPGEALVRVRAAGVNGSDTAGVMGILPFVTTPRIPGRDFSGEVVEVLDESGASSQQWIGAEVWGTGGNRGFSSDGTFSQYVVVPIDALSRKPATLDHSKAGSMTLPWLCAWITVDTLANVKEGDNVIIIGARGGIGSAAAQLCKERGARVFGTYTSLAKVTPPSYITPIELSSKGAIREAIAKAGFQNKIDVLLDCAGYDQPFNDAVFTMTPEGTGRVVIMAVHTKDGLFPVDLRTFYTKALTLKGMKSGILGPLEVKKVLDELASKIDSGLLEGPKEVKEVDITNMDAVKGALQEILTRASHVRSVIVP